MKGAPARAIQELAGTRGPVDDAALHAPESGGNGRRDPIARRRPSSVVRAENFGGAKVVMHDGGAFVSLLERG